MLRFSSAIPLLFLAGAGAAPGCTCSSDRAPPPVVPPTDGGTLTDRLPLPDACDMASGTGCPCSSVGATRACTVVAPAADAGPCTAGTQTCVESGEFAAWGACVANAMPAEETCNGVDDDCDAMTDEDLGETSCGVGACATTAPACSGGAPAMCVPLAASMEECMGRADEDCDGAIDCDDPDCAGSRMCDTCPCSSGDRCYGDGDIICYPAPGYTCPVMDGYYAVCGPRGWECMFTLPAIC